MKPARAETVVVLAAALWWTTAATARGDEGFALVGGERIVFFGDSITHAGLYITYIDAYLLTRFPDKTFHLINHGISSETIAGTSEPDHTPRRPHALPRFTRDVAAWKPDIVVSCFGMNDGNYHPFDAERFARYQSGTRTLIERTRTEGRGRLILLTPPPYDSYRRVVSDPQAVSFGYKFPAIDYDQTLERYSRWLLTIAERGVEVVDVHSALNEHLRQRRADRVSFALTEDGIHPNETGHWLMARTLLLAWRAPADCADVRIDARSAKVESGEVRGLKIQRSSLAFAWRTPIPMPIDPDWNSRSVALDRVSERLNRYRLTITHLTQPHYRMFARFADDQKDVDVGVFSEGQLSQGLDLTSVAKFPTVELSQQILSRLKKHRKSTYDRWRAAATASRTTDAPLDLAPEDTKEYDALRALAKPREVVIRLVNPP
jgi:lysophospholipase L1-like esterase